MSDVVSPVLIVVVVGGVTSVVVCVGAGMMGGSLVSELGDWTGNGDALSVVVGGVASEVGGGLEARVVDGAGDVVLGNTSDSASTAVVVIKFVTVAVDPT